MKQDKNVLFLEWDSRLFGYKVGQIDPLADSSRAQQILDWARKEKFTLLYWMVEPKNNPQNAVAKKLGGLLVDQKVTYVIDMPDKGVNLRGEHIRSYRKTKANHELVTLALESGKYSRFFIDPHFVHNEYVKLYTTWINKSATRLFALDLLVYLDEKNHIKGFVSLGGRDGYGNIGLIAVDRKFRSQSIGKRLMLAAFDRLIEHGYKRVYVTTQKKNIIGCRFYESLGFKEYKIVHVYHFWL